MRAIVYHWRGGFQLSMVEHGSDYTRVGVWVTEEHARQILVGLEAGENIIWVEQAGIALHLNGDVRESLRRELASQLKLYDKVTGEAAELARAACDYAYGPAPEPEFIPGVKPIWDELAEIADENATTLSKVAPPTREGA